MTASFLTATLRILFFFLAISSFTYSFRTIGKPPRRCYVSELFVSSASTPPPQPTAATSGCPFLDTAYDHKTYAVPALFQQDQRPIVLFDGECNLCNGFVQALLKFDEEGNVRFAALQSRVGDLLLDRMSDELRDKVLNLSAGQVNEGTDSEEEQYKTIVVCGSDNKTYLQSSAVLQILNTIGGKSKRLKSVQYLSKLGYVLPTALRDSIYEYASKRRKKWFGIADQCLLWDDNFDDRFVDDGILTGIYRDPFADPKNAAAIQLATPIPNLFEGDNPPKRGDRVRVVWPNQKQSPSISYDEEFPCGICLAGATGKITNVDLPMRVVLRVDRKSLGLEKDQYGDETMIAWVKPSEVAVAETD